jgi:hypothetical protein
VVTNSTADAPGGAHRLFVTNRVTDQDEPQINANNNTNSEIRAR